MARSGSLETVDPSSVAKAYELKKELQKLVKAIIGQEEDSKLEIFDQAIKNLSALKAEIFDQAIKILSALKDHRLGKSIPSPLSSVPEHFRCPISGEIMKDPVIVSTGQTYDRPNIEAWIYKGNRTCPHTQQVLSHLILTPNNMARQMIEEWCRSQEIELLSSQEILPNEVITPAEREHAMRLLNEMSSGLESEKKMAVKELRMLTKGTPSFRILLGEIPEAIPRLLSLLSEAEADSELLEDAVTTMLNLSIHDDNKRIVGENLDAIPLIIRVLETGSMVSRSNAAAALFTLSAVDSNKVKIVASGAMKPLIDLLENGSAIAKKDAAQAIFNLCLIQEHRHRAVADGAVSTVVKQIMGRVLVDEALAILALLANSQDAVEQMGSIGVVPRLMEIIRVSENSLTKENAVAILYCISVHDRIQLRLIWNEENDYPTILYSVRKGTPRHVKKAQAILLKLATTPHTA